MSRSGEAGVGRPAAALQGVPVLVVEDDPGVAKALKAALKRLGMDVLGPAATTASARRCVAERKPQLALVDLQLGHEMACDLIDELHAETIRIIIVSGSVVPPRAQEKAADVVRKPYTAKELIGAIHAALGLPSSSS